jgi:hypothetical protein
LAAIWVMKQGRKRLWTLVQRLLGRGLRYSRLFPKLPTLSGLPCTVLPDMIGLFRLRAEMKKSALIILSCVFASRFPCAHVAP